MEHLHQNKYIPFKRGKDTHLISIVNNKIIKIGSTKKSDCKSV